MRFFLAALLVLAIFSLIAYPSDTPLTENLASIDLDLEQDRLLFDAEANQDTPETSPVSSSADELDPVAFNMEGL